MIREEHTMSKATDLRAKDVAALEKEVNDLLRAHFGLRMQKGTQQLNNLSMLRETKTRLSSSVSLTVRIVSPILHAS